MKASERDARIEKIMNSCNCSWAEAEAVLEDDLAIDRGERLDWEPTVEEEREMRKATKLKVDRKPRDGNKPRKAKDLDPFKVGVIDTIKAALAEELSVEATVAKADRLIDFVGPDGVEYSITLTAHRKKKD